MSATLDAEQFREYFGANAPLMVLLFFFFVWEVPTVANEHNLVESTWSYVPRRNFLYSRA